MVEAKLEMRGEGMSTITIPSLSMPAQLLGWKNLNNKAGLTA